jgi:hypothetical protein
MWLYVARRSGVTVLILGATAGVYFMRLTWTRSRSQHAIEPYNSTTEVPMKVPAEVNPFLTPNHHFEGSKEFRSRLPSQSLRTPSSDR